MSTLTKENFWDEISQKYPKSMKHFADWIYQYKQENNWTELFNGDWEFEHFGDYQKLEAPKYHELPIAMQFGIFCEYCCTLTDEFGFVIKLEEFCTRANLLPGVKIFIKVVFTGLEISLRRISL